MIFDSPIPLATLPLKTFLDLNNRNARELSFADTELFASMIAAATYARGFTAPLGFLIAFDQDSGYPGGHFQWFKARLDRFVYVDRVVIEEARRGQGLARRLYDDLFSVARANGQTVITCEINSDPPNPVSDAFHAKLGFRAITTATLPDNSKTVRYMVLKLDQDLQTYA